MGDKIQFFVLDVKYKIVDNKAEIYLFSKTDKGDHIIIVDNSFLPYFYVIPKNSADIDSISEKIQKLKIEKKDGVSAVEKTEKITKNYFEKKVDAIKVFTSLPMDVLIIRDIVKDWDILESVNEYDIKFVNRYLIDKGITPMTLMEAEVDSINRKVKVPVFNALTITQVGDETLDKPTILGFDIETYNKEGKAINFEKNPIIMISLYSDNFEKVITWKRFKTDEKYIEFVDSEFELIQKFKEHVEKIEPDIITGYYSDGFDFPYIQKRAEKYKIKLDIGLDYSELNVSRKNISKAKISGIVHLDVLNVIKKMFRDNLKTNTYDLSSVSSELIGEKKLDVDLDDLSEIWDNEPEKLEIYCKYNLHDSLLVYKLAEKIMPNIIEMVKTIGLIMFEITRIGFSQLVEWYLIKQAKQFNEICPNKPSYSEIKDRMINRFQGAFVFQPEPGLFKNVVIFDFRSLYPTIISSHNISPGALNCSCCKDTAEKIPLEDSNFWFCKKNKGFLPIVIDNLIKRRMRIKDMMRKSKNVLLDARQNNLKVLANAFYGYFGFFNARWYSVECARSITALGRYYIHKVIDRAKKEGFKVIYSDTDSIFLSLEDKTKEDAKNLAESINPTLPGIMELEYEGFYPSALFVAAKASGAGAKKKYALLDSSNRVLIKGFETVRRNWSKIAKEAQENVLNIILKENNPDKALRYIHSVIDDIRERKIDISKVIIKTQLTKDIESYDSIGPHVVIAKKLRNEGYDISPGMIIEFVVTEGKGSIGDRAKIPKEVKDNKYDSSYYINNQIIPSVERIFEVLGYKKEDLVQDKKQSNLGAFLK